MKTVVKCIIIGIAIIAVGAGILIATLAANGWSVKAKYTMQTFTAEHEIHELVIDVDAFTVKTEFYDEDKIQIEYPVSKRHKTTVKEHDGKLKFSTDTKWWHSFTFGNIKAPETIIKLPKDKVLNLNIDLGAGTINLASGVYGQVKIDIGAGTLKAESVTCGNLDCDVSAGTVKFESVTCHSLNCDVSAGKLEVGLLDCPDIKADVSAGKLSLNVDSVKADYTIRASVSAGSCNVSSQTGNTDKKLIVDCSAGSVSVSFTR